MIPTPRQPKAARPPRRRTVAALVALAAAGLLACQPAQAIPEGKAAATRPAATAADARYAKPSDAELRRKLTPLQYEVTQQEGTERPFHNQYWDEHRAGLYVDVVTGEPLFSSVEKFESGTGWPSFYEPLAPENVVERKDRKLVYVRTEVRSKHGDSHLGHVFPDGPPPTGLRYCINSAALRFIPVDQLAAEGYGEYRDHFAGAGAKQKP